MYCRFRWLCKWVENRVPRNEPRPFRFGKLFHKLFEAHLKDGLTMEAAIAQAREEWIAEVRQQDPNSPEWVDALEDLETMEEPLLLWKDQYPFDGPLLEVEKPHLVPFPGDTNIIVKIRPDRVQVRKGKMWHVQHKALAANKSFQTFVELQKRSYHEHIYAEGLVREYPNIPYGGTHFDLYRKLKYRRKPTIKQVAAGEQGAILNPIERLFWQHPMPVDLSSPLHLHVIHSLHQHIVEMREVEWKYRKYGITPAPNEGANGGFYGGTPDEYFHVLVGDYDLSNDEKFKDREDTYGVAEPA